MEFDPYSNFILNREKEGSLKLERKSYNGYFRADPFKSDLFFPSTINTIYLDKRDGGKDDEILIKIKKIYLIPISFYILI